MQDRDFFIGYIEGLADAFEALANGSSYDSYASYEHMKDTLLKTTARMRDIVVLAKKKYALR